MGALWRVIWRRHWHHIVYWTAIAAYVAGVVVSIVLIDHRAAGMIGLCFILALPFILWSDEWPSKMRKWIESIWEEALDE